MWVEGASMTAPQILHGARSEQRVKRTATVQKRRLLRQIGLRAADLDGIALGYLDNWARAQAKIELMDEWSNQHGWLTDEGKPPGFVAVYFAAVNSSRLSLAKLEDQLRARGKRIAPMDLSQYRGRPAGSP
jgi:hypothetical protein